MIKSFLSVARSSGGGLHAC